MTDGRGFGHAHFSRLRPSATSGTLPAAKYIRGGSHMRFPRLGLLPLFLLLICSPLLAQDQMTYANLKTSKFANLPVLPLPA
jgi:hypothetical protein